MDVLSNFGLLLKQKRVKLQLALIFCHVTTLLSVNPKRCPRQPLCFCSKLSKRVDNYVVDCTGQNLTGVPGDLPTNTWSLILTDNPITRLPNDSFAHVPFLFKLFIDRTSLEYVELMAFSGLNDLKLLSLRRNKKLNVYSGGLQEGIFNPINNLSNLLISNNAISKGEMLQYPTKVIQDLTRLQALVIDGLNETPFGPEMHKLHELWHLRFNGLNGICNIGHIKHDFFINIPHIRSVQFIACNIEYIHKDAFKPLYKIHSIDLSFNEKLGFDGFQEASKSLANSRTIRTIFLNKIYPTYGVGIQLTRSNMQWLTNTTLRRLQLNSNRLEEIEIDTLYKTLPHTISSLSMADNKLTYGYYIWQFNYLTRLKFLDLSGMGSSHALGQPSLEDVDTRCFTTCKRPNLQTGSLKNRHSSTATHTAPHLLIPPNLKFINISRANIRYQIPEIHAAHNILGGLDLSENTLYSWQGPVTGLNRLNWLDLSNNFCNNVSVFFFDFFPNLGSLLLDNNLLGYSLEANGFVFKNLPRLTELTLSYNRIKYLHNELFRHLHNLKLLDLSNNRLTIFNISFHNMPLLSHLDLRYNFLTHLPAITRKSLDERFVTIKLLLEGNLLECSCATIDFLKWISATKVKIISKDSIQCRFDDTIENFKNIQQIISLLDRSCRNYTPFTLIGVGGLLLSVVVICTMTIYRYRWKLRYFYYVSRAKYQDVDEPSDRTFIYDCFISYAEEDGDFVKHDIVERLEKEAGLKLCVHERDFIPGKSIQTNIASAIYNSRKCVFVLSKDFFNSYWCKFEYNMARVEEMHTGRDILILVTYRYVPTRKIPAEIWEQMEVATYLAYRTTSQEETNNFWINIKRALKP